MQGHVHLLVEQNKEKEMSREDAFIFLLHSDAVLHAIQGLGNVLHVQKADCFIYRRIRHPFRIQKFELVLGFQFA